ncbi:MAG: bis(5'-nucleosyl)-tetraphosphatase (symmetrical) ApaH [Gammaproteobacteria bacterium]
MSTYVIGDIQGCYQALLNLLVTIQYDEKHDQLWFCGDLVNRGPASLEVLRFIKDKLPKAIVVLGNHDLHLLTVVHGFIKPAKSDTLDAILQAPDCAELCDWLRQQPLLHYDAALNAVLTHAGISPHWTLEQAQSYAQEVEHALRGEQYPEFLKHLYGDQPNQWNDNLQSWARLRVLTNYFTRMRFCYSNGALDLIYKGRIGQQPSDLFPWFELPSKLPSNLTVLFGHWASLEAHTGKQSIVCVDNGCVWGGTLSAYRIEDGKWFND